MRSRSISLRVPWEIVEAMEKICNTDGFPSSNACWIAAALEFIQWHRRRTLAIMIANASPKLQTYLIRKLLQFPAELDAIIAEMQSQK